jgi:hypothetical protein
MDMSEERKRLADIVRSLLPKDPDNEVDQAIEWALNMAADAVERGQR